MFGKKSVETLIVGAGPSGMVAALALADGGGDVMIVDSAPCTCTSANAAILHPLAIQTLERLGLANRIQDAGYPIKKVSLYDGNSRRQTVHLDERTSQFPVALIIPQSELEAILEDELQQSGVRVQWNHRVSEYASDGSGLDVSIDRYSERGTGYAVSHMERVIDKSFHIHAKTMIAADGYNSILRRVAGIEQFDLGPSQYFVTFEFETDRDPDNSCFLCLKDSLTTFQQPIRKGVARLLFQFNGITLPSRNREKDRDYLQDTSYFPDYLDESHFRQLVRERVPWNIGLANRLHYRAAVPFEKRYLAAPRSGRVFFLGDSARSFSPLASLSLNLGLQEAEQVAQTLLQTERDEPRVRAQALDDLGTTMVQNWKQLANLKVVASPSDSTDPWVARNGGRILRSLPATGEALDELATQIHLKVKRVDFSPVLT